MRNANPSFWLGVSPITSQDKIAFLVSSSESNLHLVYIDLLFYQLLNTSLNYFQNLMLISIPYSVLTPKHLLLPKSSSK